MSPFDKAFQFTLGNEGGYTHDAADSGGPTNWGITQHDYAVFKGRPVSIQEIKDMPVNDAKLIYSIKYWAPMGCDKITDDGVAICLFDIGVVRGIGVPPKYAQKICNAHGADLAVDGHIGPLSIAAVNGMSPEVFIKDFSAMTEVGFRQIVAGRPSQAVFLHGWVNRAHRLLTLIS